jgi:hypothetical protein
MRSWSELANVKVKAFDNQKVEDLFKQKLKDKGFSNEMIAQIHMNQRASMDGQVAETLNYEDWLKTKPTELQQQVLGQQRWQLWHDGKASVDQMVDGNGEPLSVAEIHQAVKDNVAVPAKAAVEGQAGLNLGERNVLSAMRTSAVKEDTYRSAWLSGKGIVVDQAATHTLKADEFTQLKKESNLVHLSNALTAGEYWDEGELRLWSTLSGFRGAKLVNAQRPGRDCKAEDRPEMGTRRFTDLSGALRKAKLNPGKYRSMESQIAFAFRATGKVTFATTQVGEVQTDAKLFKMIFPPL